MKKREWGIEFAEREEKRKSERLNLKIWILNFEFELSAVGVMRLGDEKFSLSRWRSEFEAWDKNGRGETFPFCCLCI